MYVQLISNQEDMNMQQTAQSQHNMPEGHSHIHEPSHPGHDRHCHHQHCCDNTSEPADPALAAQASDTRAIFRIANMDCPMEEALIRKKLATLPEVTGMSFNLMQRVLIVDHKPGPVDGIEKALRAIDMPPERITGTVTLPAEGPHIPWTKLAWAGVLAALSEAAELIAQWQPFDSPIFTSTIAGWPLFEIIALVLALAAIGLSGLVTYRKGWLAISSLNLNINALMAVAVTGAVLIGQFPEAAMVMVLFNISEAIEALALDRSRNAIRDLMALAPDTATMLMPDSTWQDVELKDVPLGSTLRVRPGQKIGLDGLVLSGHSEVNQAPITGESMPVEKAAGDSLYAGTINGSGSFEYRTTSIADNSTLARIIHAVEEAQASRAPMQRIVDIFARYYTPAIFIFAIVWAFLPPLLWHAAWNQSIYTALVILVIGCPCALVISTPVTVVSGMAAATAKGILIKGGLYLELGRRMNWLALDKTGTITSGRPKVTAFMPWPPDSGNGDRAALVATSLAGRSDHPVSTAIAETGTARLDVTDFAAQPGSGISGIIDGQKWRLGKYGQQQDKALASEIARLESGGNTVVVLSGPDGIAALYAVADSVRKTAIRAIAEMKALNVSTIMLTGDNEYTARAIAKEVGVTEVKANLLPGDKLAVIENLENQGNIVGMVGDGINDSPALAKANIGFAMAGSGTDTAIETADVALMDDDLGKIPAFIRLSRATFTILVENITLALGIKLIFFVLTLTGHATMWMAVFADVGAALLVIGNGLRVRAK